MEEVDEMINAVDDGDGLLSYDEFVNLIQKHWLQPSIMSGVLLRVKWGMIVLTKFYVVIAGTNGLQIKIF